MIQTQNILNEAGIYHSGAGMNSYEAYLPAIQSLKGQVVAFLSNSDRTIVGLDGHGLSVVDRIAINL